MFGPIITIFAKCPAQHQVELFSEMFFIPEEQMIGHTAHRIICPGGVHVVTCCNGCLSVALLEGTPSVQLNRPVP